MAGGYPRLASDQSLSTTTHASRVTVAVRIRPFQAAEVARHVRMTDARPQYTNATTHPFTHSAATIEDDAVLDAGALVPVLDAESDGKTLVLLDPNLAESARGVFCFDHVFSAFAPCAESPVVSPRPDRTRAAACDDAAQAALYRTLALPLVEEVVTGCNACLFAYGQTSSGKTYTMMGTERCPGVIPRVCRDLLHRVACANSGTTRLTVRAAYLEIYQEQVRDLLKQRPKNALVRFESRFDKRDVDYAEYHNLRVRHHPVHGPYVENLTTVPVRSYDECAEVLRRGNAYRAQGVTAMNAHSSRSHAIFQLTLVATTPGRAETGRQVGKLSLVDLAGSERAGRVEGKVSETHLAECGSINVSLSTLRRVLEALVRRGTGTAPTRVPYRESLLTYLLADSLGGNSRTVMCATVSPSACNIAETESTLRYASLARRVHNHLRVPPRLQPVERRAHVDNRERDAPRGHAASPLQPLTCHSSATLSPVAVWSGTASLLSRPDPTLPPLEHASASGVGSNPPRRPRLDRVTPLSLLSSPGWSRQSRRLLTSASTRLSPLEAFYGAIVRLDTERDAATVTKSECGESGRVRGDASVLPRAAPMLPEWKSTAVLDGGSQGELERSDELVTLFSRSMSSVTVPSTDLSSVVDHERNNGELAAWPLPRRRHRSVTMPHPPHISVTVEVAHSAVSP